MNINNKLLLSKRQGIISAFIENGIVKFYNHSLARWLTISDPIKISFRKNQRHGVYYFGEFSLAILLAQLHFGTHPNWTKTDWGFEINYAKKEQDSWEGFIKSRFFKTLS